MYSGSIYMYKIGITCRPYNCSDSTMKILSYYGFTLLFLLHSSLRVEGQWTVLRPVRDIDFKFQSISRYMETSAGGDRKAWFTIRMQAPNNAQPRADDRVTWRKVSSQPGSIVSFFEATLNNTLVVATKDYAIPKIWLIAGILRNDVFSFQMNEKSAQEVQTTFRGNSCQFGIMKQQMEEGKIRFKIIVGNCETVPYFLGELKENGKNTWKMFDYFTQTDVMTSSADNTKYRTCTVDVAGIERDGYTFKLDFIFSLFNENYGEEILEGFMYNHNLLKI